MLQFGKSKFGHFAIFRYQRKVYLYFKSEHSYEFNDIFITFEHKFGDKGIWCCSVCFLTDGILWRKMHFR